MQLLTVYYGDKHITIYRHSPKTFVIREILNGEETFLIRTNMLDVHKYLRGLKDARD